jgi:hypothetical protein
MLPKLPNLCFKCYCEIPEDQLFCEECMFSVWEEVDETEEEIGEEYRESLPTENEESSPEGENPEAEDDKSEKLAGSGYTPPLRKNDLHRVQEGGGGADAATGGLPRVSPLIGACNTSILRRKRRPRLRRS